jgi:hypothetical protein
MPIFGLVLALGVASRPVCDAHLVYAKNYAATGGAAWKNVAQIIARGTLSASGLTGYFQSATDVVNGRSALSQTLDKQSLKSVYDGHTNWRQDYSRGVHALNSPNALSAAVTNAYLNRNGYFRPNSADATIRCTGERTERGRTYYVTRVTPKGGLPVEQWIDARSFLIDRTVEETPTSELVSYESDYRQIGQLVLPYYFRQGDVADPADDAVRKVTSYLFRSSAQNDQYDRPPDPTDTKFPAAKSETVRVAIEAGDVVVSARVNGKGPFPFILDTGGHAILTPEAARVVGLSAEGGGTSGGGGSGRVGVAYTFVRRLQIGDVVIPNQPFLVIPYDNDFSDRGSEQPLAGILGLELFERLAIRIDYARSTMTMAPLNRFKYNGSGVRVPIVFQDDMPLAMATADDARGWFGVDTGNSGSLIMFGPFLTNHDFLRRYARGRSAIGSGTGGAVHSSVQEINRFRVARRTFRNSLTYFVIGQRGGSFSSTTEAGNLGYQVLANFAPTFDYRDGLMYFDPAAGRPMPARGRAGLALAKPTRDTISVVGVLPDSPASDAGIAVGDHIDNIDGRTARTLGNADVYTLMRQPPGTIIRLEVVHGGSKRAIDLTLRDLPLPK